MTTTYSRATFEEARAAWEDGRFGIEWEPYRRLAAERGYLYPPSGTRHDDRETETPSQRAIIHAAIEENPSELRRIVGRSRSWSQVVDQIIGLERRLGEDAELGERDARWERDHRPGYTEAVTAIKAVVDRIAAS